MKNKTLAIAAIQNGCQLRLKYWDGKNGCAIASLALAAGVPESALVTADEFDAGIGQGKAQKIATAITRKFGLDIGHLYLIQRNNDRWSSLARRRKAIISMIETLPEE